EAQRALEMEGYRPEASGPSGQSFVSYIPLQAEALRPALTHATRLVNATSVGLESDDSPLPGGVELLALTALDMVYRPLRTRFLKQVEAAGGTGVDGLWMLLYQAVEQLRIWTGVLAPSALIDS